MTADALPADRQRSFDVGMNDHLAKPVRGRDLEAVLDRFLPASALADTRAAMGVLFDTVVARYFEDADVSIAAMHEAAGRGDVEALAHVAHRLKGSSGIVGAHGIVRLCQELVERPQDAGVRLAALSEQLTELRDRLDADADAESIR
jgi:HPt (histidine-containing phosphotransfer) domain-containing protein